MSNIVVSEEQILNAEDIRVTLRNALRTRGISCTDDETMDSLVSKVNNIVDYTVFLNNEISGTIINDKITSLETYAFVRKNLITNLYLPNLVTMGNNALNYVGALKNLVLPKASWIPNNCCNDCPLIDNIIANQVTRIGPFSSLGSMGRLIVPRLNTQIDSSAMGANNKKANLLDLGSVPNTTNWSISNSTYLKKLILRRADDIVTLSATSVFSGTPFVNGGGKCYVPRALISSYQGGTNWSSLAGTTFISIEGSRFEDLDWADDFMVNNRFAFSKCTLDGNEIEVLDNETVAIFKHTENISHCYENGVELQDTDLVKGKTLTSTV